MGCTKRDNTVRVKINSQLQLPFRARAHCTKGGTGSRNASQYGEVGVNHLVNNNLITS